MLAVTAQCKPEQLEQSVNDDIRRFEAWFQGLGNDPMVRSEVAILKTYLYWKLKGDGDAKAGS